ncbi:LicD family protein [bacterium]|nr:LicD family protein [bacterium]
MNFKKELFSITRENYFRIIKVLGIKIKYSSKGLLKRYLKREEYQHKAFYELLSQAVAPNSLPKAKGILRNQQLFCLKLLQDLNDICKKNNLKYWIDFGTLLGALRHGGFIPWDSDTDVCMMREDYLKIIPILQEYYKNTDIVVREYGYTNHFQLRIYDKKNDLYGIDIFVMDKYFKKYEEIKSIDDVNKKIKSATQDLREKCKSDKPFSRNISKVRDYITKITQEIILEKQTCEKEDCALIYGIDYSLIDPKNSVIPYEQVFPLKTIEFDGTTLCCPNDSIQHIKNYYGENWMRFPYNFKLEEDRIIEYIEGLKNDRI